MRLICPNCTAEYEIPDDAIPAVGRDLQCSSCGVTWFSKPPEADPEIGGDLSKVLAALPPSDGPGTTETSDPPPAAALSTDLPPLDTAIADVLRQEAAAEVRLRSQDSAGGLESQPDLGLDSADKINTSQRHARESQERIGRMRGLSEQANSDDQAPPSPAAGSDDLPSPLPDVDTLGSSLRASSSTLTQESDPAPAFYHQAGFSAGFLSILIIATLLTGVYVQAGYIGELVPELTPPLDQYKATINEARLWLDKQAEQAVVLFEQTVQ